MNKVVLMGRMARDPELRYTNSAEPVAVATYAIAVSRRFKSEGQPDADFIPCKVFGKGAEFAAKYFKKGMQVAVSGSIQVRNYEDPNGQKKIFTEVLLDDQEFAESKASFESRMSRNQDMDNSALGESVPNAGAAGSSMPKPASTGFVAINDSIDDEDIPF